MLHRGTEAGRGGGLFAFSVEIAAEREAQGARTAGKAAGGGGKDPSSSRGSSGGSDGVNDGGSERGFVLQRSGRYAHAAWYVEGLAAQYGFAVREKRPITVRKEQAVPIPGLIYALQLFAAHTQPP